MSIYLTWNAQLIAAFSMVRSRQKPGSQPGSRSLISIADQIFRRRASKPNPAIPESSSGRAAGNGTAEGVMV